jgi:hypothetical protein
MRNLRTNHLETSDAIVADPSQCTRHFTPERWEMFKRDIAFFRSQVSLDTWNNSQKDHGYNGTPVWGIAGSLLANLAPASDTMILWLGLLDPLLLLTMWGFALWAFGWRATCVALLVWGTNYPARYWWNGGAFLRMDWLAFSMIGICLTKRGKLAGGGFALTYGALLRIFPGFIVIGLMLKALARMVRERRWVLSPEHRTFARGCIAALVLLIPLSAAVAGGGKHLGLDAWSGFIDNSQKHLHTPLTNNMGLRTVLSFQPSTRAIHTRDNSAQDPFGAWKDARLRVFGSRRWLFAILCLGFVLTLAKAVEKQEDWVALALGIGMIPIATELTCYYYSFLLGLGFLWLKREGPGVGAVALAAVTCLLPVFCPWDDDKYTVMSLACVLFVWGAAAYFAWRPCAAADTVDEPAPTQPARASPPTRRMAPAGARTGSRRS